MAKNSNVIVKSFGKSGFEAPAQLLERETAKPKTRTQIIHKTHWARELWVVTIFAAGVSFGVIGTLAVSTSLFDQALKSVSQALIAGKILDKTTD